MNHSIAPSYTKSIRVYYEDTDAGGVIYHANYFKFAERARTDWLRELGLNQSAFRQKYGLYFVVRHAEIDYRAAGKLDDALIVQSRLQQMGNASITMLQDVLREDDSTLLAAMKLVIVCVNEQLKATRLPQEVRQLFEPITEEN